MQEYANVVTDLLGNNDDHTPDWQFYFLLIASQENKLTAREFDAAAPQLEFDAGEAPPNNLNPNLVTLVTM